MSRHRIASASWPAIAIWAAATTCVLATTAALGYAPLSPATWRRWDSNLYLDIARHGYTLFRCRPPYPSGWCGNAGWLGLYPLLVATGHAAGLPSAATALALSWLFGLGTIVLLWLTFFGRRLCFPALAGLTYAAFAPGQVYDYAVFPISMLAFFTVACLWLLAQGRWAWAGFAAAAAAATYPLGVVAAVAGFVWLAARRRRRPALGFAALALVGPSAFVVVQAIQVGRADAYFLVQGRYGHGLRDPLGPVINAAHAVARGSPFRIASAPDVQTLFVAFVLACVLVELALHRTTVTQTDVLVALWAFVAWLVPNIETNLTLNRSQAALLPLAVLVHRLPRPLLAAIAVVAIWLSVPMTELYLGGRLL